MFSKSQSITCALLALAAEVVASPTPRAAYTKNGLTWTEDTLRMNHIQVVGSHNSYHREGSRVEQTAELTFDSDAKDLFYSDAALDIQAEHQSVRSFELDTYADPDGGNYETPFIRASSDPIPGLQDPGAKVLHIADIDYHTSCLTFIECIKTIKSWSDANSNHVPLSILVEFEEAEAALLLVGGSKVIKWDNVDLLNSIDDEIRSVFDDDADLIVPDDIRRDQLTLEESVLQYGWPDLESARGRVFFLMDQGVGDPIRDAYIKDKPNLEGRVIFTNSEAGKSDCAFQKMNDPTGDNLASIQKAVKAGYWVRTRADVPLTTVLSNDTTSMRDAAFKSGAHVVSTDFPVWGMSSRWGVDYAAQLPGGAPARCNPINAPSGCSDDKLE